MPPMPEPSPTDWAGPRFVSRGTDGPGKQWPCCPSCRVGKTCCTDRADVEDDEDDESVAEDARLPGPCGYASPPAGPEDS
jgi:hypothetical protein